MNRNIVIFVIACGLGVGAILVYAKNNMAGQNSSNQNSNLTNFTTKTTEPAGQNSQVLSSQNSNSNSQPQNQKVNSQNSNTQPQSQIQNQNATQAPSNPLPTGPITELMIKDLVVGNGQELKNGDTVEVHYSGTFLDGRKFDSSYDRGQPFSFTVGAGNVIKGWDEGLIGMKTGGKRQLIIPSDLAYGAAGSPGAIPPNTPLAFEIELIAIK